MLIIINYLDLNLPTIIQLYFLHSHSYLPCQQLDKTINHLLYLNLNCHYQIKNQNSKIMQAGHQNFPPTAISSYSNKSKQKEQASLQYSSSHANHNHKNSNSQAAKPRADTYDHEILKRKQMNFISEKPEKGKAGDLKLAKRTEIVHKKKQPLSKNTSKRPQTPDPTPSQKISASETMIYPKPELILKEIERNVNFLKEMYYASLSHQDYLTQKHSTHLEHQSHLGQSHQSYKPFEEILKKNNKAQRKSFETFGSSKKSIPQISLKPCVPACFAVPNPTHTNKIYQQFIGPKSLQAQKELEINYKQQQALTKENISQNKNKQSRKNSSKKLHQANQVQSSTDQHKRDQIQNRRNEKKLSQPQVNNGGNQKSASISNLFEIFKYYKRSIDSSLSKESNAASLRDKYLHRQQSNSQRVGNKSNNSEVKQTPNNSTAKNTTNFKQSSSRICGASIEASAQGSIQEDLKKYKKARKESTSNSATKNKTKSKDPKRKLKPNEQKNKINKEIFKKGKGDNQKEHMIQNNGVKGKQQRVNKRIKQTSKQKGREEQVNNRKFKKKDNLFVNTQTCALENKQHSAFQEQPKKACYDQVMEHIEFPEIQSSLFDKNMPILQEDSREEASSELIVLSNHKGQRQKRDTLQPSPHIVEMLQKSPHDTGKSQWNPESVRRQNRKGSQNKVSQDSLIGCEIPKRESESDLDNYELVSFEL